MCFKQTLLKQLNNKQIPTVITHCVNVINRGASRRSFDDNKCELRNTIDMDTTQ